MTTGNVNRVPKKAWARWSKMARAVFNETYHAVFRGWDHLAPESLQATKAQARKVLAWNSAWMAADAADDASAKLSIGTL